MSPGLFKRLADATFDWHEPLMPKQKAEFEARCYRVEAKNPQLHISEYTKLVALQKIAEGRSLEHSISDAVCKVTR